LAGSRDKCSRRIRPTMNLPWLNQGEEYIQLLLVHRIIVMYNVKNIY
jgi:hypothetical protein